MPTLDTDKQTAAQKTQTAAALLRVGELRIGADGRMAWSDGACAIFDMPAGMVCQLEQFAEYCEPHARACLLALLRTCLEQGKGFDQEFRMLSSRRAPVWVRIACAAHGDGALAALQDVSSRHHADQEALQRRFRELADAMPQVVWTADADGSIDFVNRAWTVLTGMRDRDVPHQAWLTVLHPDDVARTMQQWSRCIVTREPLSIEYRICCAADGGYRWQLVQARPIADEHGAVLRWYGTVTDIHDRRANEEKLHSMANRLAATLESITDALFTVDRDWRFSYVNHESERVLQRPRSELLGQQMWDAFPQMKGSRFEQACRRALAGNARQTVEELYSPLDTWLDIRIYPSEDGLAVYFTDITERKREDARKKHEAAIQAGIVAAQREIAAADLGLEAVMRMMAERAQGLLGASGGIVALVDGEDMVYHACTGAVAGNEGRRLRRAGSMVGEVTRHGLVLTCEDTETDPRVDRATCREVGVRSMIAAPLRHEGDVTGVLQVVYQEPHAFAQRDVHNLEILVESLGTVLDRLRATEALRASREQYLQLFDHNPFPTWVYERDTKRILAVNAAAVRNYGWTEQEFLGMTLRDIRPPEDIPLMEAYSRRRQEGEPFDRLGVFRHRRKDGTLIDVEVSARDITFGGKDASMAQANDVTDRLRTERDLLRVSRAQRMLSACNEAMVRAHDEARLLEEICRITVEIGGYRLAWVGYANHDEARTIVPVANYGANHGLLQNTDLSWDEKRPSGQGPSGRTVRNGLPSLCSDLRTVTEFGPGLEQVLANGLLSNASLPLTEQGETFGILSLYAGEVTHFSADEVHLLQSLANDLAFGIAKLRAQAEQQRLHDTMLKVAAGVSGARGATFFDQLARNMAEALGACTAVIARQDGDGKVESLAVVHDHARVAAFDLEATGLPCRQLLEGEEFVVDGMQVDGVALPASLPGAPPQACAGRRIANADGQPLGLLLLLFREPLEQPAFVVSTLKIFATRAAAELEQQESDLRIREQASLLDKAQDAIVVRGMDERILYWNKGAERLYGWTTEEAVGRTTAELVADDAEGAHRATTKVLGLGEWSGELRQRRKDGSTFSVEAHWTLIADDDGRPRSIFEINTDVTERKLAEEQIRQLAFYDALTGLPNRTLLLDRLHEALGATARTHATGALLFIDLDNFKALNDTLGHDVGDMLLCEVTQRLQSCVRETDTVARLGGDEFVLLLDAVAPSAQEAALTVKNIGEKIVATLNRPYVLAGFEHHSTASIGITLFSGRQNSVGDLLKRADLAMYQAKAAGRNTLRFFDPEMQKLVSVRVELEADMRAALQQQQFELFYQPQVDADGSVLGAEALVRWRHPQRGMVSPFDFIHVAEETGLILPLGHWVLGEACAQLVRWARLPSTANLVLAVNVSARQFRQPDFVDQVLALLAGTGADPTRLKLELTESLLVDNMEETIDKMSTLKECGVGFALDDFGTGYSSLAYLKRLPLDQLKIDKSFVRDVLHDPNDAAIARTIVALAQSLGLNVIAEGVETHEQRDFLLANGCTNYQGYLFSRPVPVAQFEELIGAAVAD